MIGLSEWADTLARIYEMVDGEWWVIEPDGTRRPLENEYELMAAAFDQADKYLKEGEEIPWEEIETVYETQRVRFPRASRPRKIDWNFNVRNRLRWQKHNQEHSH